MGIQARRDAPRRVSKAHTACPTPAPSGAVFCVSPAVSGLPPRAKNDGPIRGEAPRGMLLQCMPRHHPHPPRFEICNLQFHLFNPSPNCIPRHLSPLRGLPSEVVTPRPRVENPRLTTVTAPRLFNRPKLTQPVAERGGVAKSSG
jgi:hypothetical protein